MVIKKLGEENGIATIQVKLLDNNNVQCMDVVNWVRFDLAGDCRLIDNQGTSTGSRKVQNYNGTAIIRVTTNNGRSVVSARVDGVPTSTITL